jgi:hypothetical protein
LVAKSIITNNFLLENKPRLSIMSKSKFLSTFLTVFFIGYGITGCSKSNEVNIGEKETGSIASNPSDPSLTSKITPSISPSPTPVVYDVICFRATGLAVSGTQCSDDQTYKVPRGAKITVSTKTSSSVQRGSETNAYYESTKHTEKISIAEMESLASQGANVYVMHYHMEVVLLSASKPSVEVELYNSEISEFKMFDKDASQVIFTTGDTQVQVERVSEMGGHISYYKKISPNKKDDPSSTSVTTPPKSTLISSCPPNKKTFATAETNNFFLYICGVSSPTNYVGVSKSNKKSISLPLESSNPFIARNGDYTYTVTSQFLTITEKGKIIKKQPVISYSVNS